MIVNLKTIRTRDTKTGEVAWIVVCPATQQERYRRSGPDCERIAKGVAKYMRLGASACDAERLTLAG